ncbi:MAG: hypothetical protein WBM91_06555 [Eudoraea sp.]|uniref:DUF7009 family protein n=1 Tax=Eudoraea sp. TaxID=1979955 RepID=UPI003C7686D6
MKIRVLGNSRGFSLKRSEMDAICTNGYIENRTTFDNEVYTYGVKLVKDVEQPLPQFKNNNNLFLLLEKDFICLDACPKEQTYNYPSPKVLL